MRTFQLAIAIYNRELELIQALMAQNVTQKPVLRGEVGCACVAREERDRASKFTLTNHSRNKRLNADVPVVILRAHAQV